MYILDINLRFLIADKNRKVTKFLQKKNREDEGKTIQKCIEKRHVDMRLAMV